MNEPSEIQLSPVANGWIVILPHKPMDGGYATLDPDFELKRQAVIQAKAAIDYAQNDPVLESLKGRDEKEYNPIPNANDFEKMRHQLIWVFKTIEEAIAFIELRTTGKTARI